MKIGFLAVSLAFATPVAAQVVTPSAETLDPARLTAARRIIEQMFPLSQRDAMIDAMLKPLMATITQSVAALDFKKLTGTNADADDAMKRFLADEQDRSLTQFKSDLPLLADAMAKAYSRRFNEIQLSDLKSFFDTPSGRVYVRESMSMMTDPDVMNVQTAMITKSFEGFQVRLALLVREIKTRKRPAGS